MTYQKPQLMTCVDGQDHKWMIVAEDDHDGQRLEHRWCSKCGCLTQVGFDDDGQAVVAVDDQGQAHLAVPSTLVTALK